ncbi:CMRF35-like molecule 1 [Solea senegalensis]|uniref:CMRF35-like molecule 1 n=1 Tax=Solea senegalensis TaxID=28829 RepID=A0AAV6QEG9_SOLSE|nr:uncharacterized protein LOC122770600 [Solea senegalensis]KAG7486953.1 CMRF35-like molecule 1 [Solea senegalensis]
MQSGKDGKLRMKNQKGQPKVTLDMDMIYLILIFYIGGLWQTEAVSLTGELGKDVTVTCSHTNAFSKIKYFCKGACNDEDILISSSVGGKDVRGKYSISDEGNSFHVTISHLTEEDSGTYWCGIKRFGPDTYTKVNLTVIKVNVTPTFPKDITVDKLNLPAFLTAVTCMAAMPFVCLFALYLLLTDKCQRSNPPVNRETSSDTKTMMHGVVVTGPERCAVPRCPDRRSLTAPPPDLCSHFTSRHRESVVSYVNVEAPDHICQYQHLDLSRTEDHVYHVLQRNRVHEPLGMKKQINT